MQPRLIRTVLVHVSVEGFDDPPLPLLMRLDALVQALDNLHQHVIQRPLGVATASAEAAPSSHLPSRVVARYSQLDA